MCKTAYGSALVYCIGLYIKSLYSASVYFPRAESSVLCWPRFITAIQIACSCATLLNVGYLSRRSSTSFLRINAVLCTQNSYFRRWRKLWYVFFVCHAVCCLSVIDAYKKVMNKKGINFFLAQGPVDEVYLAMRSRRESGSRGPGFASFYSILYLLLWFLLVAENGTSMPMAFLRLLVIALVTRTGQTDRLTDRRTSKTRNAANYDGRIKM